MFKGTPTDPRGEHPAGRGTHPSGSTGHLTAVPSPEPEAPDVFVKPAPPSDPLRRRSEAEVLQTLRHPGTVEVLNLKDGPEGTALELAKLDAVDLLHHRALEPSELVVVFGQVCQTLGEIHSAASYTETSAPSMFWSISRAGRSCAGSATQAQFAPMPGPTGSNPNSTLRR